MPGPSHGVGSGFILDTSGNIVTNRHVIQGATKVTVTLNDGKEYPAKVIGKDAQTDVAVVRLEKPPAQPDGGAHSATPTSWRSVSGWSRSAARSASSRR